MQFAGLKIPDAGQMEPAPRRDRNRGSGDLAVAVAVAECRVGPQIGRDAQFVVHPCRAHRAADDLESARLVGGDLYPPFHGPTVAQRKPRLVGQRHRIGRAVQRQHTVGVRVQGQGQVREPGVLVRVGKAVVVGVRQARMRTHLLGIQIAEAADGRLKRIAGTQVVAVVQPRIVAREALVQVVQSVVVGVVQRIRNGVGRLEPVGHAVPVDVAGQRVVGRVVRSRSLERAGMAPVQQQVVVRRVVQRAPAVVLEPEVGGVGADSAAHHRGGQIEAAARRHAPLQDGHFVGRAQNRVADTHETESRPARQDQRGCSRDMRAGHRRAAVETVPPAGQRAVDVLAGRGQVDARHAVVAEQRELVQVGRGRHGDDVVEIVRRRIVL